jgi:hypothetical protein
MALRRRALLFALAGLHVVLALLMARSGAVLPSAAPVVYADLVFVTPPRPRVAAVEPAPASSRPARQRTARPPAATIAATAPAPTRVPAPPAAEVTAPAPAPALDLVAMRAAAGEHERQRRRDPLERVQDEQRIRGKDDSDGARAIKKAGREDCTKKYSGGATLDPLRLIPLLYDTVTDTGCKW